MDNWKILITFIYPHEAHMAKGYLDSEGINSMVHDDLTAQVNNFYSNAIGGVKVLVNDADYDRGIDVLKKGGYINTGKKARIIELVYTNSTTDKNTCPFCKSENIGRKKDLNLISVVLYFILGLSIMFPIYKITFACYDCEKAWKYRKAKKIAG